MIRALSRNTIKHPAKFQRNAHLGSRLKYSNSARKAMCVELSNLEEFNEFVNTGKPLVVDFYATWCGPCKILQKVLDEFVERVPEVSFARVDVDKAQHIAQKYSISAMPTLVTFTNGLEGDRIIGINQPKMIQAILRLAGTDVKSRLM